MSNALRVARGAFGRVALLDMDRPLVRHAHPHCHVLLKVEGADTQFHVRDGIAPLTDETAVLINAWEPHAYVHDPAKPRTVILALYIEPHWLTAFRANWAASGAPGFFAKEVGGRTPRIHKLTARLAATMVHAPDDMKEQEHLLSDLMIAVIERFTPWRTAAASLRRLAGDGIDFRLRRAIDVMRARPGEITDMGALAREAGLSRAHFFRLFQSSINVSPRVFLNVVRVEHAISAVVDSDETFAAISDRLGFSVPAHFSRFFHDHAGSSPSTFRMVARLRGREYETLR